VAEVGVARWPPEWPKPSPSGVHLRPGRGHRSGSAHSLKHAGYPVGTGLAETRSRRWWPTAAGPHRVQVDGQFENGADVDHRRPCSEPRSSASPRPLVVSGCIMMRVCLSSNTCTGGDRHPNPELTVSASPGNRNSWRNFFEFIAERRCASTWTALGLRSIEEAVGRVDLLDTVAAIDHYKAQGLDLGPRVGGARGWDRPPGGVCSRQPDQTRRRPRPPSSRRLPPSDSRLAVLGRRRTARDRDGHHQRRRTVRTLLGYEITSATRAAGHRRTRA